MATTAPFLAAQYGHEERLSRDIATHHMPRLLEQLGVVATMAPLLEAGVEKGPAGMGGRLDILQPTDAGVVIVENQYGVSDSFHLDKLEAYASNFSSVLCVVWIAEHFKPEHLRQVEELDFCVCCFQAVHSEGGGIELVPASEASLAKLPTEDQLRLMKEAERPRRESARAKALSDAKDTYWLHVHDYAQRFCEDFCDVVVDGIKMWTKDSVTVDDVVDDIMNARIYQIYRDLGPEIMVNLFQSEVKNGRYVVNRYIGGGDFYGLEKIKIPEEDLAQLRAEITAKADEYFVQTQGLHTSFLRRVPV